MRVGDTLRFESFRDMLEHYGPQVANASTVDEGSALFHRLQNRTGRSYADLESEFGVVALQLQPIHSGLRSA